MPQLDSSAAEAMSGFSQDLTTAILASERPGLGDGPTNVDLVNLLDTGDIAGQLGAENQRYSQELISGLWLLAGDIDRSHTISQDLPSADGSLLHGIMHRREGDFGNAKYWFRRVGEHSVVASLAERCEDYEDAYAFVDQCESAVRGSGDRERCESIQWTEWQLLMSTLCRG